MLPFNACIGEVIQAAKSTRAQKAKVMGKVWAGILKVNISASDIYHQLGEFSGGQVFQEKCESKWYMKLQKEEVLVTECHLGTLNPWAQLF